MYFSRSLKTFRNLQSLKWTDNYVGDISRTRKIRFGINGGADSCIALAEEQKEDAKKISIRLGGTFDSLSRVAWTEKGGKRIPLSESENCTFHGVEYD